MIVALLINKNKENIIYELKKIIFRLLKNDVKILMLKNDYLKFTNCNIEWFEDEKNIVSAADVVVIMGGDGTIMRYSKIAAEFNKLIIGINFGRLGFISSLERTEVNKLFNLLDGKYFIEERVLFYISTNKDEHKNLLLNDVVVSRGNDSQVVDYSIFRGNSEVCKFRADGVVLSTPTGSTAYSLSAGGPIVSPDVECAIITPICAHTLNSRPIILDVREEIRIEYTLREGSNVYVMCDGDKVLCDNRSGVVKVRKSQLSAKFMRIDKDRFYKNVRSKLVN